MPLLRKDNTPGGLAAELAAAKSKHERAVDAAHARYNVERGSVIDRGVTRIAQILDLQKELEAERLDLEAVVKP